jgi:hypothetical protein
MGLVGVNHIQPFQMDRSPYNFITKWLYCGGCIVDSIPGQFLDKENTELILLCFQDGFG